MKTNVKAYLIMESMGEPQRPENFKIEKENGLSFARFTTTLQDLGVKNRNGRIYKESAIAPALKAPHILELMEKKSWCGEAGHPLDDKRERILTIDPKCVSHRIVSTNIQGNRVKGVVETLDNDGFGNQMFKALLQGLEPAFSLRALAALEADSSGTMVASKPAHIVAYDWVFVPSHVTAYIDNMREVQFVQKKLNNQNIITEGMISPVMDSSIFDYIMHESKNVHIISDIVTAVEGTFSISSDNRYVSMKSIDGDTLIVPIEEKITSDVNNYLKKIF